MCNSPGGGSTLQQLQASTQSMWMETSLANTLLLILHTILQMHNKLKGHYYFVHLKQARGCFDYQIIMDLN